MIKLFGELVCDQEKIKELAGIDLSERAILSIYAEIKYFDYLIREQKEVEKTQKYRDLIIPTNFDFKNMPGLSKELQEKLLIFKPENIAQALLIQGMTPAAISLLIFRIREFDKNLNWHKAQNCNQI